jgi:hypothetical protein
MGAGGSEEASRGLLGRGLAAEGSKLGKREAWTGFGAWRSLSWGLSELSAALSPE